MSQSACPVNGLSKQTAARSRKGFTLTEIAIVLGIIGLILGAIWVAAASVYSNMRETKGNNQLMAIVQGVRGLYATSTVTGDAAGTDETAAMISAGIFPSDTVNAGATVNPWNGTTMVTSQTASVAGDAIGIEFNTVPKSACINFLTSNTGNGRDTGLFNVVAGAAAKGAAAYPAAPGLLPATTAITPTAAAAACAGATDSVAFAFKLKG